MRETKSVPFYRYTYRLAPGVYRQAPALLTFCARDRGSAVLVEGGLGALIGDVIRGGSLPVDVCVWCVMPDHVHAVVAPRAGGDVVAWARQIKGRVATAARALGVRNLWQRSFNDRVIREGEDLLPTVRYVLANPVRAGLVESWRDWEHKGSLVWDLSGWSEP